MELDIVFPRSWALHEPKYRKQVSWASLPLREHKLDIVKTPEFKVASTPEEAENVFVNTLNKRKSTYLYLTLLFPDQR